MAHIEKWDTMTISRPFREFHPAMKAAIFMLPVTLTVFLHNFVLEQPPNLRSVLRSYYNAQLSSFSGVFDFVVKTPLQEELTYRGPAWILLLFILWFSKRSARKDNFLIIGYAAVGLLLILSTAYWAFSGHHYPITVFGYGLVWSWLMIHTKNILYPVLFHSVSNGIASFSIWIGYHAIY